MQFAEPDKEKTANSMATKVSDKISMILIVYVHILFQVIARLHDKSWVGLGSHE